MILNNIINISFFFFFFFFFLRNKVHIYIINKLWIILFPFLEIKNLIFFFQYKITFLMKKSTEKRNLRFLVNNFDFFFIIFLFILLLFYLNYWKEIISVIILWCHKFIPNFLSKKLIIITIRKILPNLIF